MARRRRGWSDITVGDQFCGAGGSGLPVLTAGDTHMMLIHGAALMTMRSDDPRTGAKGPSDPLSTQVASCTQDWLLSRTPFLVPYDRTNPPSGPAEPIRTVTTLDRHAVVGPDEDLRVEDCYFRMLQPHEIGAAMAFPADYKVLGNKRDQVKQFGNAVTPPSEEWLIRRAVASLCPERAA